MKPDYPQYADIILPLAITESYTYRVPENLNHSLKPGVLVIVPLGQRKLYSGVVKSLHNNSPEAENIKEIEDIIDSNPIVRESQLELWKWMAEYYMCTLGEVYKAALPGGLKLESESRFMVNDTFSDFTELNDFQNKIFLAVKQSEHPNIHDLSSVTGMKKPQAALKVLMEKNAVFLEEKLRQDYKAKKEVYLRLTPSALKKTESGEWEVELKRSPKQLGLVKHIYELAIVQEKEIKQSLLYENFSLNIINSLYRKGWIEKYEKEILRTHQFSGKKRDLFPLSELQKKAYDQLKTGFNERNVQLLHGVTSSGKTEIYLHLISDCLEQGRQVLYLLPEIALTSQIVSRIEEVFGDEIAVYHSKFNDSERVDVYRGLLKGKEEEKKLILGVRSAIFLPFRDLGLVIVDEEHENTYKQFDPAPRYHARDSAIVLASVHQAKVVLGTATPSVESYQNSKNGKFGLVELSERFGGVMLPEIRIVDLRKARLKKEMRSVFSPLLIDEMKQVLEQGKQIILFQNRRGYSSFLECESCGWIPKCRSCDVSLTYHKFGNNLRCHYCGYSVRIPEVCGDCNSSRLITRGFGTELVEDELEMILPGTKIARLDLDSTRSRKSYERILTSFGRGETNVLVGTQMLSKGLDFENVALVGILNADQMLNFPDFRAFERSFQLMSQVSGRAGRKKERGKVIIQTSDPGHPVIKHVINNDFASFYKEQVYERQEFKYPPYVRIIKLSIKSKEASDGWDAAGKLAGTLRKVFGKRILGPQPPVVSRIKNWYIQQIIIKVERTASFKKARDLLRESLENAGRDGDLKKVRVNIDVDPL